MDDNLNDTDMESPKEEGIEDAPQDADPKELDPVTVSLPAHILLPAIVLKAPPPSRRRKAPTSIDELEVRPASSAPFPGDVTTLPTPSPSPSPSTPQSSKTNKRRRSTPRRPEGSFLEANVTANYWSPPSSSRTAVRDEETDAEEQPRNKIRRTENPSSTCNATEMAALRLRGMYDYCKEDKTYVCRGCW